MDQNTQQVAVALQGIVDQYEMILEIDTGDEMGDSFFNSPLGGCLHFIEQSSHCQEGVMHYFHA